MADEMNAGNGGTGSNTVPNGSIQTGEGSTAPGVTILSEVIVPEAHSTDSADEVGLVRKIAAPALSAGAAISPPSPESVTNIAPPPIAAPINPPIPQQLIEPPVTSNPVALPPTGLDIKTDIEKILREVKLPERRDFKASADITKPVAQSVQPPPQSDIPSSQLVTKPPAETETVKPTAVSAMHTLKDDLQHAVKEKKMSVVRAVSLEQDKKARIETDVDFGRIERRKRLVRIIFSSIIFTFLGAAALFGVYTVVQSRIGIGIPSLNSIVFAEQSVSLPLDNAPLALKQQIAAFRNAPGGSLGSITRIIPAVAATDAEGNSVTRPATLPEFLSGIGAKPPEELIRALGAEFFFGVHVVDKNAPIIVATVTSYDHAFAGMLAWEETINPDLAPAFTPVPVTVHDANGIPSARLFKDDVMRNYDVRELKDDAGQIQLYYSFPNSHLLVIAESPYSFPEILSRLQSERRL